MRTFQRPLIRCVKDSSPGRPEPATSLIRPTSEAGGADFAVLGSAIGTALGWGNAATVVLSVALAFFFGYSLTMLPLLRSGVALAAVLPLAFASDTLSITVMEIVDNLVMVLVPGAMEAGPTSLLFWGSLAFALLIAGAAAFPVDRYLISRGRGHAVVHRYHGGHHEHTED